MAIIWIKSVLITTLVLVFFLMFGGVHYKWELAETVCSQIGFCQCEEIDRMKLIAEPINTYSSLFYLLVGLVVFFHASQIGKREGGILILVSSSAVSLGSIFYHASASQLGLAADFLGISFILSVFYIWRNLHKPSLIWHIAVAIFVSILTFFGALYNDQFSPSLIPQFIVALYGTAVIWQEKNFFNPSRVDRNLYFLLVSYIAAYACWIIGNTPEWCDSESLIQFHSIWHFFGAIAIYFAYKYLVNTNKA